MKLFELFDKQPLREDKTLKASIKLCESVVRLLEAEGDFEFVADPAFAGVKGVTRASGAGELAAQQAQQKQQNAKLNATWVTLVKKLQTLDAAQSKVLKVHLQKVADAAKQRGFTLSPNPDQILGL